MKPAVWLAIGVWGSLVASGCDHVTPSGTDPIGERPPATSIEIAPTTTDDTMEDSSSRHRATVATDAGRIEATSVQGELDVDVASHAGWTSAVERHGDDVRIAWSSGDRHVVVKLHAGPTGISQEVVASG